MIAIPVELSMVNKPQNEVAAYEQLLTDAMNGDAMLFMRDDRAETAWAIVAPLLDIDRDQRCRGGGLRRCWRRFLRAHVLR